MTSFTHIKQKNFLSHLFDVFILSRRDFVIETMLPLQEIVDRIQSLENETMGCICCSGIAVEIGNSENNVTTFRLTAKTLKRTLANSTAYIEGEIFDEADSETRIAATVMIAGGTFWIAVIWSVFLLLVIFRDAILLFGTLVLLALIFTYIRMYLNRNNLINLLEKALNASSDNE